MFDRSDADVCNHVFPPECDALLACTSDTPPPDDDEPPPEPQPHVRVRPRRERWQPRHLGRLGRVRVRQLAEAALRPHVEQRDDLLIADVLDRQCELAGAVVDDQRRLECRRGLERSVGGRLQRERQLARTAISGWVTATRNAALAVSAATRQADCVSEPTIAPEELAAGGRLALFAATTAPRSPSRGCPRRCPRSRCRRPKTGSSGRSDQRGSEPTSSVPPTQHDFPFYLFLLLLVPATAVGWVALKDRSVKAVV